MRFVVSRLVPTALAAQQPADMIVTNARIHAVDEALRPPTRWRCEGGRFSSSARRAQGPATYVRGKVVYERSVLP
jgi:hypothetical protein